MTTHHYLISFCNNKQNNGREGLLGMVLFDQDKQHLNYQPVPLPGLESHEPRGITGLCHHKDGFAALLQAKVPQLLFLDHQFHLINKWPLHQLKGVHTILSDEKYIYFSVTGQDLICRSMDGKSFENIWSTDKRRDTIHLNSICFHENQILFTAFGPKAENNLWSSAKNGLIQSVEQPMPLKGNIWHPHSLTHHKGQLYFCHSSRQRIESLSGVIYDELPGYTRGLHVSDELLVCGTSKGRLVSHSTGKLISNISDKGILAGECGVWVALNEGKSTQFLNLDQYASEVFEVR